MSIPYRVSSNFLFPIYAGTLFGGTLCAKSKDHDYGGLQRFYSSLATSIDRQWPEGEVLWSPKLQRLFWSKFVTVAGAFRPDTSLCLAMVPITWTTKSIINHQIVRHPHVCLVCTFYLLTNTSFLDEIRQCNGNCWTRHLGRAQA